MATSTQWQLSSNAATLYEQVIVPNILGPFAAALVEWAAPPQGATVVDVGCGTGAATRVAAERVGAQGRVIGVDVNAGMIAEARSLPINQNAVIEWHEQSAYQLPVADHTADMVISAQVVQFLQEKPRAFQEMQRALKPGGNVAFSVWCDLPESPYFHAQVESVSTHIGAEAAAGLRAGFALGDQTAIQELLQGAGFTDIEIVVKQLDLLLPNLEEFIPRHINATPLAVAYNAAPPTAQRAVIDAMTAWLSSYVTEDKSSGGVRVPFRSYLARATNRS